MATCDPQTLLDEAQCLACLTPQQLGILTVKLLCDIKDVSLTGGITCDDADPVDAPAGSCAIWINTDDDTLFYWNGASWVQLIL